MVRNHAIYRYALYGLLVLGGGLQRPMCRALADVWRRSRRAADGVLVGWASDCGGIILSRQAVFDTSVVGKAANAKFKALHDGVQGVVNGEEAKLVAEAKALDGQKGALAAGEYQSRQQQLDQRLQLLRQEAAVDNRDLEATRQDTVLRISKEAQPVIAQVYKDKSCGLVVSRDAILAGNPAMDITAAVVAGLDAKITTIEIERKHVTADSPTPRQP